MNLLEYCMQTSEYRSSPFKNQLCYVISRTKNLFCFYSSIAHAEELILPPPPLSPEVLSPVQTRNLISILFSVIRFAVSLTEDEDSDILMIQNTILRVSSVFVEIIFDPTPSFMANPCLQLECQNYIIKLAERVKAKKPLVEVVGDSNPLFKLVN